uniref:Uncharacterized protein n=1 Tax=Octopus bimaculoides TaxID=37653 RepID=A0A0L8H8P8_OCTBM
MAAENQSLFVSAGDSKVHLERIHRMSVFSGTASRILKVLVSAEEKTSSELV